MSTALTPLQERSRDFKRFLERNDIMDTIQKVLPQTLSVERITKQAVNLAYDNPKLLECSQFSLLKGIIQAGELGLELSGPLGQAYLIPRRIKGSMTATFQVGWRGLVTLAYRSGKVKSIQPRRVHKEEEKNFIFNYGTSPYISHKGVLYGDLGPVVAYYTVALIETQENQRDVTDFVLMSVDEVVAHRQKYSPKGSYDSAWDTNFDEMAMKTTTRALCKRLPFSVVAQTAAMLDEYHEKGIVGREEMALPTRENARTEELMQKLDYDFQPAAESQPEVVDAALGTAG